MTIRILFIIALIVSLFLETTLVPFPLFVFFSVLFFFFSRRTFDALIIFFLAFFLDAARAGSLGFTPLYLSLVFLLTRDSSFFNIHDVWFFGFLVFAVTVFYGFLSGYAFSPTLYILFLGGFLFTAVTLNRWVGKRQEKQW